MLILTKIKKDVCFHRRLLRIEAKNHTPHSVLQEGMFLDLHNSAHRLAIVTWSNESNKYFFIKIKFRFYKTKSLLCQINYHIFK